jgi:hypothetical protein
MKRELEVRGMTVEDARRSCFEKRRYATKNEARDSASKLKDTKFGQLYPYRCRNCGNFHLTRWTPEDQAQARKTMRRRAAREGRA